MKLQVKGKIWGGGGGLNNKEEVGGGLSPYQLTRGVNVITCFFFFKVMTPTTHDDTVNKSSISM